MKTILHIPIPHGKSTLFEKWKRYMDKKEEQKVHKFICEKHAEKIEHEGWDCPACLEIEKDSELISCLKEELEESQQEVAELTGENVDLQQEIEDLKAEIKQLIRELGESK